MREEEIAQIQEETGCKLFSLLNQLFVIVIIYDVVIKWYVHAYFNKITKHQ